MKYRIAFKNLPFVPVREQVIYVENLFDEKTNRFIKDNYHALVNEFNMYGLEFVYLPLYFDSAELEKKVRYYAPYLVSRINDEVTLRSSYILDYMVRPENRPQIPPSLLFAPEQEQQEWIFKGLSLDVMLDDHFSIVNIAKTVAETLFIANSVPDDDDILYREGESEERESCGIRFRIADADDRRPRASVSTASCYEAADDCGDYADIGFDGECCREPEVRFSKSDNGIHLGCLFKEFLQYVDDEESNVDSESAGDVCDILANLKTSVESLRLMGVALGAIHEFIDNLEPLSPLVITEDLRLFLPLYNNIEIELSAQRKALYFLFLNHPEGIVLQHLEDYHNELLNYYKQANKGVLTPKMEESIKKLEVYDNNQLNVLITRIKEAFCLKFDERLARNYFISGEKGEAYRIPLDPDLVKWEE